ncbi:hypothetical protein OROMI_013743 [Orobanche minor]
MLPETMDTAKTNSALGYGKPPWVFKGSALYQFHLVKSETARAFIPKEFKLVEAFGYTLGGFFLANYEDSPAGKFDEKDENKSYSECTCGHSRNCLEPTYVVRVWAARVLVSSDKACIHGQKDIGLPSQIATFTKSVTSLRGKKRSLFGGFLNKNGMADSRDNMNNCVDIQVKEMRNHTSMGICSINLTAAGRMDQKNGWDLCGRTEYISDLLKYSCRIECSMLRAVSPVKVLGPSYMDGGENISFKTEIRDTDDIKRDLSISVMLSKPILALEFNCLKMKVDAPTIVPQ